MRQLCENCLRLDLAEPALRKALDPARSNAGTICWSEAGGASWSLGFVWAHVAKRLIVTAHIDGVAATQKIIVTSTSPHFGGVRLWFTCPITSRRSRLLLLAPGRREWVSRTALGLSYASQRMSGWAAGLSRAVRDLESGQRRNAMRRVLRRMRRRLSRA